MRDSLLLGEGSTLSESPLPTNRRGGLGQRIGHHNLRAETKVGEMQKAALFSELFSYYLSTTQ